MAKAPKTEKPNFSSFTKAELIRTIKTLSARETKHLNTIAKLQRVVSELEARFDLTPRGDLTETTYAGAMGQLAAGTINDPACRVVPVNTFKLDGPKTLADMAALDKALDAKGMHVRPVAAFDVTPIADEVRVPTGAEMDDILERDAGAMPGGKFPWERG